MGYCPRDLQRFNYLTGRDLAAGADEAEGLKAGLSLALVLASAGAGAGARRPGNLEDLRSLHPTRRNIIYGFALWT